MRACQNQIRFNGAGSIRAADMTQISLRFVPVGAVDVVIGDLPGCSGALVTHCNCTTAVWYCIRGFHDKASLNSAKLSASSPLAKLSKYSSYAFSISPSIPCGWLVNFTGGAVTLIFTVERFNSAIHHREAHFCFALVARLAERLNLMR